MLHLEYEKLLEYCKSLDFDQKIFKIMHDNYTKTYNRLNQEEQGKIAEMIALRYRSYAG